MSLDEIYEILSSNPAETYTPVEVFELYGVKRGKGYHDLKKFGLNGQQKVTARQLLESGFHNHYVSTRTAAGSGSKQSGQTFVNNQAQGSVQNVAARSMQVGYGLMRGITNQIGDDVIDQMLLMSWSERLGQLEVTDEIPVVNVGNGQELFDTFLVTAGMIEAAPTHAMLLPGADLTDSQSNSQTGYNSTSNNSNEPIEVSYQ